MDLCHPFYLPGLILKQIIHVIPLFITELKKVVMELASLESILNNRKERGDENI